MKRLLAFCATVTAFFYSCVGVAQHGAVGGEWREYSGDTGASKYSPLDQINRSNVAQLRVVWRRPRSTPRSSQQRRGCALRPTFAGRH